MLNGIKIGDTTYSVDKITQVIMEDGMVLVRVLEKESANERIERTQYARFQDVEFISDKDGG